MTEDMENDSSATSKEITESNEQYIGNSMVCTRKVMDLVAQVVGLDIIELWTEGSDKKVTCTYVYATRAMKSAHHNIITGHYPTHHREHVLSPSLCNLAKNSRTKHYWKVKDNTKTKIEADILNIDVQTELSYCFEADGINVFIVGFMLEKVPFKKKLVKFMAGISYSIYVAAFDLDDEGDDIKDENPELSGKQPYQRRSRHSLDNADNGSSGNTDNMIASSPYSSFDVASNIAQNAQIYSNFYSGDDSNENTSQYGEQVESNPESFIDCSRGRVGSAAALSETLSRRESVDRLDIDSTFDIYEAMPSVARRLSTEDIRLVDGVNIDDGDVGLHSSSSSATFELVEGYIGEEVPTNSDHDSVVTNKTHSTASLAPTWEPVDTFAFPIGEIAVSCPVPDNLVMEHFTDIQYIADGSNANIFLARLNDDKIVIKMIKEEIQTDPVAVHEFNVEHGILSRVSHENIIKLVGAGRLPRRFIVLEWLGGGTLNSILQQNQVKPGLAQRLFRRPSFTYNNLLSRAKDITDALHFLNNQAHKGATIIHRDLKPDNIGFTADGKLKLFDFGLCTCVKSRVSADDCYQMTGNTGSLRYMAPEVARKQPYNEKADVHSFGIVLWQMARDRVPFKGMSREQFMDAVVRRNERPKLDKSWPKEFSDMLSACWNPNSKLRPSFMELSKILENLLRLHHSPK
jgi:hypothetical protein